MNDFNEQHPRGTAGKFTEKTQTEPAAGVITDAVLLNTWPGPGAALNGTLADKVVTGATAIRIRENNNGTRYAETIFPPIDLQEHLGDVFVGSDMGDTTQEWIEQHSDWVRAWFRDRNVTIGGDDWTNATLIHISDLYADAETFHDVTDAFNKSLAGPTIRDGVTGAYPLLWNELESDIKQRFCDRCFGDTDGNASGLCDTCEEED